MSQPLAVKRGTDVGLVERERELGLIDEVLGDAFGGRGALLLLHGLHWLTANLADEGPLLVLVDDAQRLDDPSLRFLRYLTVRIDELPVALLVARRSGEPAHEQLSALAAEPGCPRARPRRLQLTGVEALTPMERRTAVLAAEGLSNREVAQSLFLTVRTIEMHLTHAYRKLGVASRRELGRALAA
jgi:DNA-binding CsgD family transcriptional regulator